MIKFVDQVNEHNKNWSYIPDHPYRILIIVGSGSGKSNVLLNLIENQPNIDKIYLYAKNPYEAKFQYLINKRESVSINHFNDNKAFIEYSNDMRDVYKNINHYNPEKENKILITQSYFKVPKDVTLNTTHFFISKIPHKRELQQIVINHSSDINTKDFTNIYRKCIAEPYSFLVNDTTLASDNPLRFRKLFLKYNKNHDN